MRYQRLKSFVKKREIVSEWSKADENEAVSAHILHDIILGLKLFRGNRVALEYPINKPSDSMSDFQNTE